MKLISTRAPDKLHFGGANIFARAIEMKERYDWGSEVVRSGLVKVHVKENGREVKDRLSTWTGTTS